MMWMQAEMYDIAHYKYSVVKDGVSARLRSHELTEEGATKIIPG